MENNHVKEDRRPILNIWIELPVHYQSKGLLENSLN